MYKSVVFDLDGTIYFGSQLANSANEVIQKAREICGQVFFATNNSAKTREQIYSKLKILGVDLNIDELLTVSYLIPKYLKQNKYTDVYCVGTEALKHEISQAGINPISKNPQAVVVGFNPDFKLHDLDELANIKLTKDCKLIIANKERVYPVNNGYLNAGASPIVASVESLLNKTADITVGKPNIEMLKTVFASTGIKPQEVLVVGDSYESDIKMAQAYGADAILITDNKKSDCKCINKLSELLEIIK